jgi:hypothetical protein
MLLAGRCASAQEVDCKNPTTQSDMTLLRERASGRCRQGAECQYKKTRTRHGRRTLTWMGT